MDPKTPIDYALHAVFIQFATSAETKIDGFLREALVWYLSTWLLMSSDTFSAGPRSFASCVHGTWGGS